MEELKYHLINSKEELKDFVELLENQQEYVFDLESNSLDTHADTTKIVGIGFCWKAGECHYIPFNGELTQEEIVQAITPSLENDAVGKIGHNLKYDVRLLNRFDINVRNIAFDTMVASYCIYGDRIKHNLDDLVLHHINHIKIRTKTVIPKKSKTNVDPSMFDTPVEEVKIYCCEDVDYTYRLYLLLKEYLTLPGLEHCRKIFYEVDLPLVSTLAKVECAGAKLDESKIDELRIYLAEKLVTLQSNINAYAGREVGLTKPADISACLFDELQLHTKYNITVPKTKLGYSTAAATLDLFKKVPIVADILEYKACTKLMSTYIVALPNHVSKHTGFIHTSYGQTITATARLNSSSPNLQQIPSRTEIGKKIRKAFVSRFEGGQILAVDYSQAELRILAHMGQEQVFLKAYGNEEDVHTAVAADVVYEIPKEQVDATQRSVCKTVNFGLLYGMRAKKLAATLGIELKESSSIMSKYMKKMKGLKGFLDNSREFLKENGYTENFFGRRRYIPKIFSTEQLDQWGAEREGANNIIQSTNADMIRKAMNSIQDLLDDNMCKSVMILQVHDELVFDVHPDEMWLKDKVIEIMEGIVEFDVHMRADGAYADDWAGAH